MVFSHVSASGSCVCSSSVALVKTIPGPQPLTPGLLFGPFPSLSSCNIWFPSNPSNQYCFIISYTYVLVVSVLDTTAILWVVATSTTETSYVVSGQTSCAAAHESLPEDWLTATDAQTVGDVQTLTVGQNKQQAEDGVTSSQQDPLSLSMFTSKRRGQSQDGSWNRNVSLWASCLGTC